MKGITKIIAIISILFLVQSCCYKKKCEPASLNFNLVGFMRSEINTINIRKFVADDNFRTQKDIMVIYNLASLGAYNIGDTTVLHFAGSGVLSFDINPGFDYIIQLPDANRSYRITQFSDIQGEITHCRDEDPDYCENDVNSFKVNGVIQTKRDFYLVK